MKMLRQTLIIMSRGSSELDLSRNILLTVNNFNKIRYLAIDCEQANKQIIGFHLSKNILSKTNMDEVAIASQYGKAI